MKNTILLMGATGMVGGEVLKECLKKDKIAKVISLTRKPTGVRHKKLQEVLLNDFLNYQECQDLLDEATAVMYCLGVYTGAVPKEQFRKITVDYPVALVNSLKKRTELTFCLLSGQGADRKEKSRLMFARDKGAVENQLSSMGFRSFFAFRPGYIYPSTPRKEPNMGYVISRYLYPVLKLFGKNFSIPSADLAKAMVQVALEGHPQEILENKTIVGVLK